MESIFAKHGFIVVRDLFTDDELVAIHTILLKFHQSWLQDNAAFYQEKAINSAYITGTQYLRDKDRQILFEFVGSASIAKVLAKTLPASPAFVGSQLFFDPANLEQQNYWHRDIQYNDWTIEEQKQRLTNTNALHFRVPLANERGIELVPGSHRRWDTADQYDVRMAQNGRAPHHPIEGAEVIALDRGDLLVFSGNMIHRGLYGGDRFAFDILFGDAIPEIIDFVAADCLPSTALLANVQNPSCFTTTLAMLQSKRSDATTNR